MILRLNAESFELSEELMKYARGKLEDLDKYVPRKDRATMLVEVSFSEQGPLKTCQLLVKLPREEITARETTQHMYASLDVAVVAAEQHLREYRRQRPGRVRSYLRDVRKNSDKNSTK